MLTRSLALEEGKRLRVFGFRPGVVDTGMQVKIRASGLNPVSQLKREDLAPPEQPAQAMVYLSTPSADDLAGGEEIDIRDPRLPQAGRPARLTARAPRHRRRTKPLALRADRTILPAMRQRFFLGLSPAGFHRVAYWEHGPGQAAQTVVCVHGLTRNGRDFDALAGSLVGLGRRVGLPGRGRPRRQRLAGRSGALRPAAILRRHGGAGRPAGCRDGRLGRHFDGRFDRHAARGECRARRSAAWC